MAIKIDLEGKAEEGIEQLVLFQHSAWAWSKNSA
jgi:hypothetical protein